MPGSRGRIVGAVLFSLILTFTACLEDVERGVSTVTGNYTLRSVNGSALPYTLNGPGSDKTEYLDDSYLLNQGGSYSRLGHMRVTTGGQTTTMTITEHGNYALLGTSITFTGGESRVAVSNGAKMTFVDAGVTQIFEK